ncbi:hypothetical protein KBY57_04290 [Cyanobium sp. Aljojuca 7D2]|uniref:putative nucleotide-diphospho-sugar transferase n=1 Tax=Cyanobium sp. Aljojuca 7D2 TaxID=2823698 RepID=UPI0020CCEBD7|nr:putative nucleotide-diphospho-sugar transferase [Cyanobium sp. Aljojuca 7D2]MCP9890283.1 hypothetical protein [Cyanobium sp. Aljojuca 7D2]
MNPAAAESLGVVLVATGVHHRALALQAARSVRRHCPGLPVVLFSDAEGCQVLAGQCGPTACVDDVIPLADSHRRSKVDALAHSPFTRTLYLDADTRLVADVRDVFALLDRFDIALAHAHARNRPATQAVWRQVLPDAFPQFNSGVIAWRRNPATQALLKAWPHHYRQAGFRKDQVTLRELLWQSDLRIATLPPEYNIRYRKTLWLWRHSPEEARPRILHLRPRLLRPHLLRPRLWPWLQRGR